MSGEADPKAPFPIVIGAQSAAWRLVFAQVFCWSFECLEGLLWRQGPAAVLASVDGALASAGPLALPSILNRQLRPQLLGHIIPPRASDR